MAGDKINVLLVEDDAMIVDMYKLRLESEGYIVKVTDKGSEAISWSKTDKPDIILLDIMLPEIDGFSILQSVKNDSATSSIPVLLLTNLGQESDKEKGVKMGAVDYFVKAQHTPADIIAKVKQILHK